MKINKSEYINIISSNTIIEGNIKCDGDIRLDGKIIGNILSDNKVVIGNNGKMLGKMECNNADILGYFNGNIKVSENLFLKDTANIKGNIYAKKLIVESGAILSGNCNIGDISKFNNNIEDNSKNDIKKKYN